MIALVYGAAGSQQFPVIKALQNKGASVVATTHTEDNIVRLEATGAEVLLADMNNSERLKEINEGIEVVSLLIPFFLPNPADGFEYAKNAIDAAVAHGIKLIVWNASGFILPVKIGNPALDIRLDIQEYLQKSGVPYIIIQPSVYAENLLGPWTAPFVKKEKRVAYPTPEEMPIGWIATQDVAALVAEAMYSPHLAGQSFQVSGLENLSGSQLAEKFSLGLGQRISYYPLPPKDFGKILDSLWGEGAGKSAENFYQEIYDTKQYPQMFSPDMPAILQKLPVEMTDIQDWVMQHRAVFEG